MNSLRQLRLIIAVVIIVVIAAVFFILKIERESSTTVITKDAGLLKVIKKSTYTPPSTTNTAIYGMLVTDGTDTLPCIVSKNIYNKYDEGELITESGYKFYIVINQ